MFFYIIETEDTSAGNPSAIFALLIAVFASMFFAATGPIAGFILSLVGLKKTRDKGVNGRGFAIASLIINSILLLVALLFIALIIYISAEGF